MHGLILSPFTCLHAHAPHVHAPLAKGSLLSLGTQRDERSRCVPAHTLHGGAPFICKFCRARPLPRCNLTGSQSCRYEQTSSTTGSIPSSGMLIQSKLGPVHTWPGQHLGPSPRGISGSGVHSDVEVRKVNVDEVNVSQRSQVASSIPWPLHDVRV